MVISNSLCSVWLIWLVQKLFGGSENQGMTCAFEEKAGELNHHKALVTIALSFA